MNEQDRKHHSKSSADHEMSLTTTEARQGVTAHVTRYVLSWGLGQVILAFIMIYLLQR